QGAHPAARAGWRAEGDTVPLRRRAERRRAAVEHHADERRRRRRPLRLMRRFGNPWRSFLAWLPATLALATPAIAGDYALRLGVDQDFEYNNNIDFTPDDETAASSYILAPGVGLD